MNNSQNKRKSVSWIMLAIFTILLIAISQTKAATFDVGATICAPYWYCTGWSDDDCGTRTCMDANSCGTNYEKPSEFEQCDEESQAGGGGSGGSSSSAASGIVTRIPDGYFTLNYDNIRVNVYQNQIAQKIIIVNSSTPEDYTLEILYPSSYTKGTEFLTTTSSSKKIDGIGDFNIIIDTRNILIGTYVIPIKISNGKQSEEISVSIDVLPEKNAIADIKIDSKLKTLGVDHEMQVYIQMKGAEIVSGDKLTYSIIDPKGNTIMILESEISNPKEIIDTIQIPTDIQEGYYTLSARVESQVGQYVKSIQFTVLEPQKYYPVMQQPKNINISLIAAIIIIFIMLAVILRNTILSNSIQARVFRSEMKWRKNNMRTKIVDLRFVDKIKKIANIFKRKDKPELSRKAELLKQSYEKGYISLKEYNTALNSEGYHVGQYDETPNKAISREIKNEEKMKAEIAAEKKKELEELKKEEKKLKEQIILEEKEKAREEREERKEEEKREKEEKKLKKEEQKIDAELKKEEKHLLKYEAPKESILDKGTRDHAFVTQDGVKLHSVRDLLLALEAMPNWVFDHHTGQGRNDFATWVGDVFRYLDVAEDIRNSKSKEDLIKALKRYE